MASRDATPATSPVLRRLRAALVDPRLLVGVLLVAGSTAGVVALVATADETTPVYVAEGALLPGQPLDESDLVIQGVGLPSAGEHYLVPGDIPEGGLIVTRAVADGELVPATAVGSRRSSTLASVVISTSGALPESVGAGAEVDVWSAAEDEESGKYATPTVLVDGAIVVRLVSTETIVAGGEVTAVEVLVSRSSIARLLEAIANDAALSIVPTSMPAGR
ncbi:hypothetical protein [Antiquaquibacter soli]|uniref:SAF domain-containing protein n=1 Tax=Antiquaquibacter soli TaxID=3064523 RepID=A0ABT9BJJ1_9MICO|nr:hypothetical protein [Protaetiibacter sp. WY-16]MDO7881188.1 hypothetical protein [Protaetiibacter sp. WY-16]